MDESSANYLSESRRQALEARRRLIKNKEIVSYSVLQEGLGRDWPAFNKAISGGQILILYVDREHYIPAFYLDKAIDHLHLESVMESLGDLDPWTKWQFFKTPKLTLNGATPLEALRESEIESVLSAAAGFSEL